MNQRHMNKKRFRAFPLLILAAALLIGWAVKLLWNAILPAITGASTISYWQAVGLLVLCRLLMGNFGGNFAGRRHEWHDAKEKNSETPGESFQGSPWRRRWMNMTDEDRLKFRAEMRRRCGKPPRTQ